MRRRIYRRQSTQVSPGYSAAVPDPSIPLLPPFLTLLPHLSSQLQHQTLEVGGRERWSGTIKKQLQTEPTADGGTDRLGRGRPFGRRWGRMRGRKGEGGKKRGEKVCGGFVTLHRRSALLQGMNEPRPRPQRRVSVKYSNPDCCCCCCSLWLQADGLGVGATSEA